MVFALCSRVDSRPGGPPRIDQWTAEPVRNPNGVRPFRAIRDFWVRKQSDIEDLLP